MGQKVNSEKFKKENEFFINSKTNKVQYNKKCLKCACNCKQSFRSSVVCCPYFTAINKNN